MEFTTYTIYFVYEYTATIKYNWVMWFYVTGQHMIVRLREFLYFAIRYIVVRAVSKRVLVSYPILNSELIERGSFGSVL